MKKLISLLLALVMVFSLATVAFAATGEDEIEPPSAENDYNDNLGIQKSISKTYNVLDGTAPAETFTFKFTPVSYKNGDGVIISYDAESKEYTASDDDFDIPEDFEIPAIADQTISFAELTATSTSSVDIPITVSQYLLGVYTYRVDEVEPNDVTSGTTKNTAGTTYEANPLFLVLTILRDEKNPNDDGTIPNNYVAAIHYENDKGEKTGAVNNSYNAGSLEITKNITGNMAAMSKKFTFTVVLTPPADTEFKDTQIVVDSGVDRTVNNDGSITVTVQLGNGETLTIENIPVGTNYTVAENAENYKATVKIGDADAVDYNTNTPLVDSITDVKDKESKIIGAEDDTYEFTNELTTDVDTGITLDTLPFVLILAVCAGAVVLFVVKRRRSTEF